jgi:hypothetical protein
MSIDGENYYKESNNIGFRLFISSETRGTLAKNTSSSWTGCNYTRWFGVVC